MAEKDSKKSQLYDEYGYPFENYSSCNEEADTGHEFVPPKEEDYVNKKSKAGKKFIQRHGVMIMQTAAVCLAVVVVKDAFGYDVLAHDPFNDEYEYHHMEIAYAEPLEDVEEDIQVPEKTEKEPIVSKPAVPNEKAEGLLDEADDAFPTLTNLEPNGYVPGYGVLDEQYVMMEYSDRSPEYIYRMAREFMIDEDGLHLENGEVLSDYYYLPGATIEDMYSYGYSERYPSMTWSEGVGLVAYKNFRSTDDGNIPQPIMVGRVANEPIPGAYYDEATNTLTLNNYIGEFLNVNLMGNGFKLRLVGENELRGIVVWGFMYGGSLTITGDGKLTINHSNTPGIRMECENSASCLMIDSNVTLEINGNANEAIVVKDSTLEKGIYYLKPLEAKDKSDRYLIRTESNVSGRKIFTFTDEKSNTALSMRIAPKEDE